MSYVAPVRAVLVMMCTASAATSSGPDVHGAPARTGLRPALIWVRSDFSALT